MSSIIGTYCDFCQITHFSNICYHPGRKLLEAAEVERDRLRAENAELRAHLDEVTNQNAGLWQTLNITSDYADELADRLDAQGQHPGFPQSPAGDDPNEPVVGTA